MDLHITKYGTIKPSGNGYFKECSISKFLSKLDKLVNKMGYYHGDSIGEFSVEPKATIGTYYSNKYEITVGQNDYSLDLNNAPSVYRIILKTKLDELVERYKKLDEEKWIVNKFEEEDQINEEIEDVKSFDVYLKHLQKFRFRNRLIEAAVLLPTAGIIRLFIRFATLSFKLHFLVGIIALGGEIVAGLLIAAGVIEGLNFDPTLAFRFNKIANLKIRMIKQTRNLKKQMLDANGITSEENKNAKNDLKYSNSHNASKSHFNVVANYLVACLNDILKLDKTKQLSKLNELRDMITRFTKKANEIENISFIEKRSSISIERAMALDMLKEIREFELSFKNNILTDMNVQLNNNDVSMESLMRIVAYYIDAISQSKEEDNRESSDKIHKLQVGNGH